MRVAVIGAGAVGARAARQLHDAAEDLVVVDADGARAEAVVSALGKPARLVGDVDDAVTGASVTVLAVGTGHRALAERALERGADVVSVADTLTEVSELLELDPEARERGRHVVAGAGFSPGLACVLARHAAADFDRVDEVHVCRSGTGGPACARQHHRALSAGAVEWRDRAWVRRRGGSGRELCWFPDPIGAVDCYRGGLAEPLLLAPAFDGVQRVSARLAASRRERMLSWLPMLGRAPEEGGPGGLRVEVRGGQGPARAVRVLGAIDRPSVAAGVVAAVTAVWVVEGRLARTGVAGLAELVEPVPFLAELARRGVRAAVFEGTAGGVVTG